MHDPVNNPAHYQTNSGLEAIEVIEAFFQDDYHLGNAFKYLARAGKKDDREQDLRKAVWYIERSIQKKTLADYPAAKVKVVADLMKYGDLEDFIHEGDYWVHSHRPFREKYYLTPDGVWKPAEGDAYTGYYYHEGDIQLRLEEGSLLPGRGEE